MLDAGVVFDFAAGDLLDALFRLPFAFCTPDLLTVELKRPPATLLVQLGLEVETMPGESLVEIIALRSGYSALSLNDVAAFVLARNLGVGLLTGDRRLRALAEQSGVEVHGTLWLLERMITHELIARRRPWRRWMPCLSRQPPAAAEVQKFRAAVNDAIDSSRSRV